VFFNPAAVVSDNTRRQFKTSDCVVIDLELDFPFKSPGRTKQAAVSKDLHH